MPAALGHRAGRFWDVRAETANRVRGRIEQVLGWATVRGLRKGDNPAAWRGHLEGVLPARNKIKTVKHHEALPWADVPGFMAELRQREAVAARALEFLILCASRTGEVTGALWSEIDLTTKVWTIPPGRIKGGKQHRVALSDRAVAILKGLPTEVDNPFIFIGARRGGLSHVAMPKVLERRGATLQFTASVQVSVIGALKPLAIRASSLNWSWRIRWAPRSNAPTPVLTCLKSGDAWRPIGRASAARRQRRRGVTRLWRCGGQNETAQEEAAEARVVASFR